MKMEFDNYDSYNFKTPVLVSNYINSNFSNVKTHSEALIAFIRLSTYLKKQKISDYSRLTNYLLKKNDIFIRMNELIYTKYKKQLENNTFKDFFVEDSFMVYSLNAYLKPDSIKLDSNNQQISGESSISCYVDDISGITVLESDEEFVLALKVKARDLEARREFIEKNLGLVIPIAKYYANKCSFLEFEDLIQEGNIAVINAVENFDPYKGYKFSAYAHKVISRHIEKAIIKKERTFKISEHLYSKVPLYKKAKDELEQKLNRDATSKEIAAVTNISQKDVELIQLVLGDIAYYGHLNELDNQDVHYIYDDIDVDRLNIEDVVINSSLRDDVDVLLNSCLLEKERKVIKLRFGLNDNYEHKLEEIGDKCNVTRERVRQVEGIALKKIREYDNTKAYAEYFDNPKDLIDNLHEIRQNYIIDDKNKGKVKRKKKK